MDCWCISHNAHLFGASSIWFIVVYMRKDTKLLLKQQQQQHNFNLKQFSFVQIERLMQELKSILFIVLLFWPKLSHH